MSTIFPMCITLIAGYVITREQMDDTLKNILIVPIVPISFKKLLAGKLIVCGLLSLLLGVVCTIFTVISEFVIGFPSFSAALAVQALWQITLLNFFLYLSVLPIIILTSCFSNGFLAGVIAAFVYGYGGMFAAGNMKLANLYPVTASLGLIGYRSYDAAVHWNTALCLLSMGLVLASSIILVTFMKNNVEPKKVAEKSKKTIRKKGW